MTSDGRSTTLALARASLTVALTALAAPATSQEASTPPAYMLLSESTVLQEDSADWADALALTAKAHAKHAQGNTWVSYRKLTGGPHETVRSFFPLDRMGDLDTWVSNRQVVQQALGPDRARTVLQDLDLVETSSERVLAYSEKLSRPWPNFSPPRFAWVEEVRVEDGKMVEYAALAQRIVRTFEDHGSDGYWVVYGNAIGGDSSTLLWIYGFDQFAEIDAWESRLEALAKAMPAGEAGRLIAAVEAISEATTGIWQLEPALSQLGAK